MHGGTGGICAATAATCAKTAAIVATTCGTRAGSTRPATGPQGPARGPATEDGQHPLTTASNDVRVAVYAAAPTCVSFPCATIRTTVAPRMSAPPASDHALGVRSEERRVGKESRA